MSDLNWLSDEAWAVLEPYLPKNRPVRQGWTTAMSSAASCMCFALAAGGRAAHPSNLTMPLNGIVDPAAILLAPVLPVLNERYPEIEVDIAASNRMTDIVGEGFDAGDQARGGTVPEDMVAQRLSADLRWVVAASPAYIARFGRSGAAGRPSASSLSWRPPGQRPDLPLEVRRIWP